MKPVWLFGPLLLCIALISCGLGGPSPEDAQEIAALQQELEQVRSEIAAANNKNATLSGGLVKALVETRIEIVKTTESLIQQRIHALESGAKITVVINGAEPNEELAIRLEQEINSELLELSSAREEAARYSGGLVSAMKQATVATQEQTVAMLRQKYLAATYGLPSAVPPATSGPESGGSAPSEIAPEIASPSGRDLPRDASTEVFSVMLLSKRFAEQDYQEFIWFDIEFTAIGLDKPARAIKGVLKLQDLFGEPHMRLNWTIDEPTRPGETIVEKGSGFGYNQFLDPHRWVRATDIEDMTASFTVESILYQDGTRLDF